MTLSKGDKRRWSLADAEQVAHALLSLLSPSCVQIAVAGSIRRKRPDPADIELLCIPKPHEEEVLLGPQDQLDRTLMELLTAGDLAMRMSKAGRPIGYGKDNKFLIHRESGIPVDIFSTEARYWGMALFVRTGPAEWNIKAMTRLKYLGTPGHAYGGITRASGEDVDCPDEETVFRYLGRDYRAPWERA